MGVDQSRTRLWTGTTRRNLLKGGLIAGVGILASPWIGGASRAASPSLQKYVDPLPVPPVVRPSTLDDGIAQYAIRISQFEQKVHRDLPPTTVWGYNGSWPGPTFETRSGRPIQVVWVNDLPVQHLLEY